MTYREKEIRREAWWLAHEADEKERRRKANGTDTKSPPDEEVPLKATGQRLSPLDIQDFFELDIPPRGMILDPAIPEKGLTMLYASRGIGKTHIACGISYAAVTRGLCSAISFVGFSCDLEADPVVPAGTVEMQQGRRVCWRNDDLLWISDGIIVSLGKFHVHGSEP